MVIQIASRLSILAPTESPAGRPTGLSLSPLFIYPSPPYRSYTLIMASHNTTWHYTRTRNWIERTLYNVDASYCEAHPQTYYINEGASHSTLHFNDISLIYQWYDYDITTIHYNYTIHIWHNNSMMRDMCMICLWYVYDISQEDVLCLGSCFVVYSWYITLYCCNIILWCSVV